MTPNLVRDPIGYVLLAALVVVGLVVGGHLGRMLTSGGAGGLSRRLGDPLDRPLFSWSDATPFAARDLVKGVAVFGQTGSGKSSGSNLRLIRAVLAMKGDARGGHPMRSGGIVFCSKPEDRPWFISRLEEAGRLDDLIVFAPDSPHRCNFVDYELQRGGDARSLTQFVTITGEFLDQGAQKSEAFWIQGQRRLIYNAIVPIRIATGVLSIPAIQRFIATAAYTAEQAKGDPFKQEFHYKIMAAADRAKKSAIDAGDYQQCIDFWAREFLRMDEKPRSSIIAGVTNILHTYNAGLPREMISTTTTVSPDDLGKGKWILVDFPIDEHGDSGRIIMHGWKYLVQKYILRRRVQPGDPIVVIHADEAQEMTSSFDAAFLAKTRSHLGTMIYLSQSLHSYFGEMQQDKAKELLTNFGTIIAHSVGDPETAQYLSSLLGKHEVAKVNVTPRGGGSGPEDPGCTLHTVWEDILPPRAFLSGLRAGGGANAHIVDGIVLRTGTPFHWGQNYLYEEFNQG